eukprot:gene3893-7106_t
MVLTLTPQLIVSIISFILMSMVVINCFQYPTTTIEVYTEALGNVTSKSTQPSGLYLYSVSYYNEYIKEQTNGKTKYGVPEKFEIGQNVTCFYDWLDVKYVYFNQKRMVPGDDILAAIIRIFFFFVFGSVFMVCLFTSLLTLIVILFSRQVWYILFKY